MARENVRVIGIAWYQPEHYERAVAVMDDGSLFPGDYASWLRLAQDVVTTERLKGSTIVRAEIDPDGFVGWCRTTRQRADVEGRTQFVNEAIAASLDSTPRPSLSTSSK